MKSGFASIIGRPNAGKSTLLNALTGEKIAIVTPKPQTTRNRITGIVNVKRQGKRPAAQIVLLDTPGVHKSADKLTRRMMQEVSDALNGCDLILYIVDADEISTKDEQFTLDLVKQQKTPTFLLLNKVDRVDKQKLLPMIESWSQRYNFAEIIPISAYKKEGLDTLLDAVARALPEGPKYFPEDQITDQPMRFIAAELIREALLLETQQEVPYSTSVLVDNFEEDERLTRIAATIFCERTGQKAIIIGKQGSMLKAIGTRARKSIERLTGNKVFLELFVKVKANWRESADFVDQSIDWKKQLESIGAPKDKHERKKK
jgi:GTP-binding protein Era